MSSGGYTSEQCCLRMGVGERNRSQLPISILHSQMHEIWEVNEYFLHVSLNIMGSSIYFFYSTCISFSDPYWEFITVIVWRYIIRPCYFPSLFPSFVSKIQLLFQSRCGCKSNFHLNSTLDTQSFSACVCSLQRKEFLGDPGSIWLFPAQLQSELPHTWQHWWDTACTRISYNLLISPICPVDAKHQFWKLLHFLRFFTRLGRNFHGSLTSPAHRVQDRVWVVDQSWNFQCRSTVEVFLRCPS